MDPVMRAVRVFLAEMDTLWWERPERVLPLLAEPSSRSDVVRALRLGELAPENRRPLFLYEEPFTEAEAYFGGFTAAIERDYAAVRKGVAAEGVNLPAFSVEAGALAPVERAVLGMERAVGRLGERFDGATFALVPPTWGTTPLARERPRARSGAALRACGSRCTPRRAARSTARWVTKGGAPRRRGRAMEFIGDTWRRRQGPERAGIGRGRGELRRLLLAAAKRTKA